MAWFSVAWMTPNHADLGTNTASPGQACSGPRPQQAVMTLNGAAVRAYPSLSFTETKTV